MAGGQGRLWRLFAPLALSDLVMALSGPLLSLLLARLPQPERMLAAYGVAEAVAILLEAPIIMLLHASTALARGPRSLRDLTRFALGALVLLTAAHALLALSPLYGWIFEGILALPPAVAAAARPAFLALVPWVGAIGWRRLMQGILIHHGRSGAVGWASAGRLAALAVVAGMGFAFRWPGALVAGLALTASVVAEAAWVTVLAVRLLRSPAAWPDRASDRGLPFGFLWPFYLPLAMTSTVVMASRPLLSAGIARGPEPLLDLAAWPVAWGHVILLANGTRMVQQLSLALLRDADSYRELRRFTATVGLAFTGLLILLGLAGDPFLRTWIGVPGPVAERVLWGFRLLAPFPWLVAWQNWRQSLLIRAGRTSEVQWGAVLDAVLALAFLYAGVTFAPAWISGVIGAALALLLGLSVEVLWLGWRSVPLARRWAAREVLPPSGKG